MSKEITTTVQPSRRTLLKTVGAVGVAAAGGVLSRQAFSPAIAAPAPKIRLAWPDLERAHLLRARYVQHVRKLTIPPGVRGRGQQRNQRAVIYPSGVERSGAGADRR